MNQLFVSLKYDHAKIKNKLSRLLKLDHHVNRQLCQAVLADLKDELYFHQGIEETLLYPTLTRNDATRELAMQGYEEHHLIDNLLEELEGLDYVYIDTDWQAKLIILRENVIHHFNQEENELFQLAEESIPHNILLEISNKISERKNG